ncbi:glycosyltransferase, partial [bacterium]|nr:glycosyltransferase [bacterium]
MPKRMVSIVIPVYNEEKILEPAVEKLKKDLAEFSEDFDFELVLAENGSRDNTLKKGEELSAADPFVSIFHHPEPDYGLALQAG